jgi:putative DNA primase/helicase
VVRLQRRKRNEAVDRFYHFEAEVQAKPIRERLEQWAVDHLYLLAAHEPQLPEQLGDRAQEVWLPLLTIADLIGGDWPARARKAAIALSGAADGDEESKGVQLLTDIRRIFAAKGAPEAIFTSELLEKLNERDESPWGTWNKGVGLRPHDLAKLLRPFTISPHQVRIGEQSKKGYRLEQFQDAWVRYLPKDRNRGNTETSLEEDDDSGLRFEVSGVSDDPGISDTEAFDEEFNRWREQLEEDR